MKNICQVAYARTYPYILPAYIYHPYYITIITRKAVDAGMIHTVQTFRTGIAALARRCTRWRHPHPQPADPALLADLRDVQHRLKCAQERFDQLTDYDLLEACIYEMESLQAQYRYLLRQIRARGMACPGGAPCP
jgi:hypothetical protein